MSHVRAGNTAHDAERGRVRGEDQRMRLRALRLAALLVVSLPAASALAADDPTKPSSSNSRAA
jgi:hypothetical protein